MRVQFLEAGKIVTTHGIHGEMKILPWADGPEFLLDFNRIHIDDKDYTVKSCRVQKSCNLLKLNGIDTIEAAQAFRGKTVKVYRDDAPSDIIFVAELIGVRVYADNVELGKITDVMDCPGNKVYVIEGEHTYMIPAVRHFILSTDLDAGVMQVQIIEGMRTDEN